jgi:uncharacterized membrane protein
MDPVAVHVVRGLVALVFLVACAHKLRAPRAFAETLHGYALLPDAFTTWFAAPIVLAELAVGVGLLVPALQRDATAGAIALLLVYAAGISINLMRGRRDIDCGCAGPGGRQSLSGWLVLRNLLLAAVLVATFTASSPRALGAFDQLTIALGAATLYALYAASNLLLAYAPRTKALLG